MQTIQIVSLKAKTKSIKKYDIYQKYLSKEQLQII